MSESDGISVEKSESQILNKVERGNPKVNVLHKIIVSNSSVENSFNRIIGLIDLHALNL